MPCLKLWGVGDGVKGVLIARGAGLEWWVATDGKGTMSCMRVIVKGFEETKSWNDRRRVVATKTSALDDITALADGEREGEIVVSRVSGLVQRLKVVDLGGGGRPVVLEEKARYALPMIERQRPGSTAVQALHSNGGLLVSASTTRLRPPNPNKLAQTMDENDSLAHALAKRAAPKQHQIVLHSLSSPWESPSIISLPTKPWSVQLSPSSTPTWLAIGHTGTSPLSLVQLDSTGSPISTTPTPLAFTSKSTSVYSLTTPSLNCSPFLRPDQTLIAAFFDSTTRIYDLRLPSPSSSSLVTSDWDSSSSSSTNEILRLIDPWSDDPSYSVSSGGSTGSYISVGSARNSAVRLFDIRSSSSSPVLKRGITAFGPGGDRSPVYGLGMENSRVWAVTERKGFVFNLQEGGAMEESVSYVEHEGERKGKLRRTGEGRIREID